MALPLALIIGALLLLASAGVLAKLIMARSSSSAESYKQLAELAAVNGTSRIIAKLNDTNTLDISYLWRLNQDETLTPSGLPTKEWDLGQNSTRLLMDQPCASINLTATNKATLLGGELSPNQNLRSDGRSETVGMSYRLRSYNYSAGDNKANLQVEGYATQGTGTNRNVLSRSLITRTVALKRKTSSANDWGVIAAKSMNLGQTTLQGPGRVLWLLDRSEASRFSSSGACLPSSLGIALGSTNINLQQQIWPIVGSDFPSAGLFDQQSAIDSVAGTKPSERRIWNIDDSSRSLCGGNICTRGELSTTYKNEDSAPRVTKKDSSSDPSRITLHREDICKGEEPTKPCLIWIERINLSKGATLSIETGDRPVVLRMLREKESINIKDGKLCQADNSNITTTTLPCSNSAKAENLAIVATSGDNPTDCTKNANQVLRFSGNSLPEAIVLMASGRISITSQASMNGLLWARNICATPGINISSVNRNGDNIIDGLANTWQFDSSVSFGRTFTRGIRGTALDMFRKW